MNQTSDLRVPCPSPGAVHHEDLAPQRVERDGRHLPGYTQGDQPTTLACDPLAHLGTIQHTENRSNQKFGGTFFFLLF